MPGPSGRIWARLRPDPLRSRLDARLLPPICGLIWASARLEAAVRLRGGDRQLELRVFGPGRRVSRCCSRSSVVVATSICSTPMTVLVQALRPLAETRDKSSPSAITLCRTPDSAAPSAGARIASRTSRGSICSRRSKRIMPRTSSASERPTPPSADSSRVHSRRSARSTARRVERTRGRAGGGGSKRISLATRRASSSNRTWREGRGPAPRP